MYTDLVSYNVFKDYYSKARRMVQDSIKSVVAKEQPPLRKNRC